MRLSRLGAIALIAAVALSGCAHHTPRTATTVDLGGGVGVPPVFAPQVTNAYLATVQYETTQQSDLDEGGIVQKDGLRFDIELGWAVCLAHQQSVAPGDIATTLADSVGLTTSGSQAIVAAALRTMCTSPDTAYRTNFDLEVERAQARIKADTGLTIPALYLGWAMKDSCAYLQDRPDAHGLREYLLTQVVQGQPLSAAGAFATTINRIIRDGVAVHCANETDKLAAGIT